MVRGWNRLPTQPNPIAKLNGWVVPVERSQGNNLPILEMNTRRASIRDVESLIWSAMPGELGDNMVREIQDQDSKKA